jgi:hypothetical protein
MIIFRAYLEFGGMIILSMLTTALLFYMKDVVTRLWKR